MASVGAPVPDGVRSLGPALFLRMRDPVVRRVVQLLVGLVTFGVAIGVSVESRLGVSPWTVFHGGASEQLGLSIGTMVVITGATLLFLFIPLREPFGLGTALNVAVIGPCVDITLWVIPDLDSWPARIAALIASPVLLGLASGLYIGSGLGPGPRDGLMTAMERRGIRVDVARTIIEVTALAVGWLLGGDVGVGTVVFAITVGWFVKFFLQRLRIDQPEPS